MSLGKVPMKAVGGAKRNASIEQVSTATQRAATTQYLFPSKVLGRGKGVTRDLRQIPKKTDQAPSLSSKETKRQHLRKQV